uniref:Uncharacterized protein n=1 Tax=Zea mays TaxID=4577 RepID=C0HGN7_MAIZE|nr:unknown [Zea mays]
MYSTFTFVRRMLSVNKDLLLVDLESQRRGDDNRSRRHGVLQRPALPVAVLVLPQREVAGSPHLPPLVPLLGEPPRRLLHPPLRLPGRLPVLVQDRGADLGPDHGGLRGGHALSVLHDGRGQVSDGLPCVVEHGDLAGGDVPERDLAVPEPVHLAQRVVGRGGAEDPAPDAARVAAAEAEEGAAAAAVAERGLEPGLGAGDADVAGPLAARRRQQADHEARAPDGVRLGVARQPQLPRAPHRGLHAGAVEPRRGALAPHQLHLPTRVRRVQRRHGRPVRDLLQEHVEAGGRGDVVRLPEHRVVGREAEDGGPRGGDAPRHHGAHALQAVGAARAPRQHVLAAAVHGLAVQLQLRLGQVERRRQLEVGEVGARADVAEQAEHPLAEVGRAELPREPAGPQRQRRRQHGRARRLRLAL